MTITIPTFVFTIILPVYFVIGLLIYIPLEYHAWSNIHNPEPFWKGLRRGLKNRPYVPLLVAAAWPYFLYQEIK